MKYSMSYNYISPYDAGIYNDCIFNLHRHYDLEIIMCLEGHISLEVDNKKYDLYPNQMIILAPLIAHSANTPALEAKSMFIKFGSSFLGDSFTTFTELCIDNPVIDLNEICTPWQEKTKVLLNNIRDEITTSTHHSKLLLKSDLYRLSAYILESYQSENQTQSSQYHSHVATQRIDTVFQYVFANYYKQITVEDAAKISGYTKEYFCKIFKQLSGEPFHQFLNRVRIENAKFMLANTTISINEISVFVGINECDTFRRVFKHFTNTTPSEYRKKQT